MITPEFSDSQEELQQAPMNRHEKIGRFVEGAAQGALGGVIGAIILHKIGISFEAPVESVLISVPAVAGGLAAIDC